MSERRSSFNLFNLFGGGKSVDDGKQNSQAGSTGFPLLHKLDFASLCTTWSLSGQLFAVGDVAGDITLFRVSIRDDHLVMEVNKTFRPPIQQSNQMASCPVACLAFSPSSRQLAASYVGLPIHVYSMAAGTSTPIVDTGAVTCLAWSGDDHFLAVGLKEGVIQLHQANRGFSVFASIPAHSDGVYSLDWGPLPSHRHLLLSAGMTPADALKIWDVRHLNGPACTASVQTPSPSDKLFALARWAPNCEYILCGDFTGQVTVFDPFLRFLARIDAHALRVRSLAISPDSRYVATAGEDQLVQLWDIPSRRCLHRSLTQANGMQLAYNPATNFPAVIIAANEALSVLYPNRLPAPDSGIATSTGAPVDGVQHHKTASGSAGGLLSQLSLRTSSQVPTSGYAPLGDDDDQQHQQADGSSSHLNEHGAVEEDLSGRGVVYSPSDRAIQDGSAQGPVQVGLTSRFAEPLLDNAHSSVTTANSAVTPGALNQTQPPGSTVNGAAEPTTAGGGVQSAHNRHGSYAAPSISLSQQQGSSSPSTLRASPTPASNGNTAMPPGSPALGPANMSSVAASAHEVKRPLPASTSSTASSNQGSGTHAAPAPPADPAAVAVAMHKVGEAEYAELSLMLPRFEALLPRLTHAHNSGVLGTVRAVGLGLFAPVPPGDEEKQLQLEQGSPLVSAVDHEFEAVLAQFPPTSLDGSSSAGSSPHGTGSSTSTSGLGTHGEEARRLCLDLFHIERRCMVLAAKLAFAVRVDTACCACVTSCSGL